MAVGTRIASVALVAALLHGFSTSTLADEIAFLAWQEGYWQACTMDEDGSNVRIISRSASDKTRVSWFPDAQRLLVSGNDGLVRIVERNTGAETIVPLEHTQIVDAVLSPDGSFIAYSFSTAIDGNDIWVAGIDGNAPRKIVRQARLQHEPSWSPDGRFLYFLSGDGGQAHDIWRVELTTGQTEQLTVGNLYHFDVAVASDGRMAFSSNRSDGNYEIYLHSGTDKTVRLTEDPGLDARPAFSSDGRRLFFESTRSGQMQIWQLDLKKGKSSQVTKQPVGARAPAVLAGVAP